MKTIISLVIFITFLLQNLQAQNIFTDRKLQKIYDFQDKRSTDSLLKYFPNTTAALAFASSQDTIGIDELILALKDTTVAVRNATAYALGQIATPEISPILIQQFDNEVVISVKQTLLEAIGKTGFVSNVLVADFNNENLTLAQLKGLYRAATWKKMTSSQGTEKAITSLNNKNKDIRFWAASYLARNPTKTYTDPQIDTLLVKLQAEKDAFVRMNIASSLSNSFSNALKNSVLEVLLTTISKDENEFVRINSIRTLSRFDTTTTQKSMLKYLQDSKPHVAIVASEFVKTHARKDDEIDYFHLAEKARHPQVRANLLAVAVLYEKKLQVSNDIKTYFKKTTSVYEKGFILNSLANNPQNYEFIQQQIKLTTPNPLNTFAFEALNLVRNSLSFDKIDRENKFKGAFEKLLIEIVNGNDAVLIGLAATELRNEKRNYKTTIPTVLAALKTAKEKLPLPLEIEAVIEIQKTIDFFEEKVSEVSPKIMFNNAIDWAFIETLPEKPQVQIKTSKGLIVIELFTNDAPASVANFLKLTKQGFYNDKVFHRVVQNFVVQTGCPRGDGYGNVPFSIRSEFANLNYGEGYLGMASAGKDTEGSQWFITHSPTPHLDGRYTIFGRVISGMDIVNKLEIGDKVIRVE